MRITQDSYFCIGTQHQASGLPCQDYAYAGVTQDNIHYAIVSDGCSSSQDSDIGSRMVTHWFRSLLEKRPQIFPSNPNCMTSREKLLIIDSFKSNFADADLPHPECLNATLIAAFVHRHFDLGYILIAGDGAFSIKDKAGNTRFFGVNTSLNAPPYLSYHLNEGRKNSYRKACDSRAILSILEYDTKDSKLRLINASSPFTALQDAGVVFAFDHKNVELVSIFTDGVMSFGKVFGEPVAKLTDVKTFEGYFVARTCIGVLKRMAKDGIHHYDDLSMAALKFHDEENNCQDENGHADNP